MGASFLVSFREILELSLVVGMVHAFLKASGRYSDEQIVEWVLGTCFGGLLTRPS